jgi:predicted metal-dependent phosphoesterase TrpH
VRIDLHAHSDRSDGTDSPGELVRRAREAGVDVLALTDHDTAEGWAEASAAAALAGVGLVPGIEISCKHAGHGVHLLAYLPDPGYRPLADELGRVLDGRTARLPAILDALRGVGIDIDAADVRRLAGETVATGRPHVADALVDMGVVRDRDEAFARFLGPRGPAYVKRYGAPLVEMIGIVARAGGVTVLAHPWAERHNHDALDEAGLAELKDAGLAGLEVDHQEHSPGARERLRAIARDFDLVVTGGSDYHGRGKVDHDVGCNTTEPHEFERLMGLAGQAAAGSGRVTPQVVGA